ncbi:response regulator transcription factor [Schlegelella sp. S2-27]|uniref:Response regulator transcription factor n=1 Tax=Caldimonas mangrovi TaxID=2944811 RepID=A0ABT0YT85_9BURK|nr:response regulator transcription factor [Caldimonas mangrovi]MCM5681969.1 response regulator transcription factor [Caldimonas mangrovi]
MIEVMLVEDDLHFAERFAEALERSGSMRLAARCGTVREALERLQSLAPDVLLVDLGLPDGNGIEVIRSAVQRYPNCDVLVVTMYGDQTNVLTCIEAGASGYLLKEAVKEDIVKHIDDLRSGGSPISPVIARQLLRKFQPSRPAGPAPTPLAEHVTERELQVLQLLARGFNYQEIAGLLGVSIHTIGTYIKRIYRKLHVNSRGEAVYEAQQMGILK